MSGPQNPPQNPPSTPPATAFTDQLPQLIVRLSDLRNRAGSVLLLEPTGAECAAVAADLGIPAVRKLRFSATLSPVGRRDWRLEGQLGATVVQDCVVTLDPVTTRIDEPVLRTYLAELPEPAPGEVEMPQDDSVEPLPATLDLAQVMIEALALALPIYPRAPGVAPLDLTVTEPGKAPLGAADVKPFAGLAGLRDALRRDDDEPQDGSDQG